MKAIMPEGDTLFRIAAQLAPSLEGQPVVAFELQHIACERLVGHQVTRVEARGKNLLVHFDEGTVLHTHLRMGGAWHLYRKGERWRRSLATATVILAVPDVVAVCFRAPVARLMRASMIRGDSMVGKLGPDLLSETFDEARAMEHLRAQASAPLGVAIMDQRVVAGIGNVYKSEILFHEKLDPFAPVSFFSDEELGSLLAYSRRIMAVNANAPGPGHGRTTRESRTRGEGPVSVYRRAGEPCYDCRTPILMERQGELRRSTYYCPRCQPERRERSAAS
jgi:endonuclease-8